MRFVSLAFLFIFSLELHASIKVLYIAPSGLGFQFHQDVSRFMLAVADDLDVELDVITTMGASPAMAQQRISTYIEENGKPNYIISTIQRRITYQLLQLSSKQKIPFYTVNTDILKEEMKLIDKPRGKFRYWLGQMVPNDKNAGKILASALIQLAQKKPSAYKASDNLYHLIGISGGRDSSVSFNRNQGLLESIENNNDVILHQIQFSDWSDNYAFSITPKLLKRFPTTKLIWAASDQLASGVFRAIPDKNVLIGGIDWSIEGLNAVKKGELAVSVGGHFMEAGWALLLLHDHFHGIEFADTLGTRIDTEMSMVDKHNIDDFLNIHKHGWSQFDFKHFSKVHNTSLSIYDFSLQALLKAKH